MLPQRTAQLELAQMRCYRRRYPHRDSVLQVEQVGEFAVEAISPDHLPRLRLAQFHCNTQHLPRAANATMNDVANVEVEANPTEIERSASVGLRRTACNDYQIFQSAQCADDVVDHSLCEIRVRLVPLQSSERKDSE